MINSQVNLLLSVPKQTQGGCFSSEFMTTRQIAGYLYPNMVITSGLLRNVQRLLKSVCPSDVCVVEQSELRDIHIKKYKIIVCIV